MNNLQIAETIKKRRELLNLSQDGISEEMEIKKSDLSKYENAEKQIGLDMARKFRLALNTTIEYLIYGEGEENEIVDHFDCSIGNDVVNSLVVLHGLQLLEYDENKILFIHPRNTALYDLVKFLHTYLDHNEILEVNEGKIYIKKSFEKYKNIIQELYDMQINQ